LLEIDHKLAAEEYFRRYAESRTFRIEKFELAGIDLMLLIPAQPRLNFEISVGLDANDSLFVDAGRHRGWWYIIGNDFDEAASRVSDVLDGLIDGTCRVAETWQFGKVSKTAIEQFSNGTWKPISTHHGHFTIPFFAKDVVHLKNQSGAKEPKWRSEARQQAADIFCPTGKCY
jgi:hypothetical protein